MTEPRYIYRIAGDVIEHWRKKDGTPSVYFGAVPYLSAMQGLSTIDESYGQDNARGIVTYFLSNATTFRGEHARRLKAELRAILES